jgi:nitrite reductase/ring-hydroxylating ferredoxin subunit
LSLEASAAPILVCEKQQLVEAGLGRRFFVEHPHDGPIAAFAVRVDGHVRAYLNRCSHVPVELDWQPGHFLDDSGLYIVCATHGAMYDASNGACVGGPCRGAGLKAIEVFEDDTHVWCQIKWK